MARNNLFDESSIHLRWGTRLAALVVAICGAVLLAQDVLPVKSQMTIRAVAPVVAASPSLAPVAARPLSTGASNAR